MSPNKETFEEIRYHVLARLEDLKALEKEVAEIKVQLTKLQVRVTLISIGIATALPYAIDVLRGG